MDNLVNCKNCSTTVNGNFCAQCGQQLQLKRVDWHYVLHEIQHVLHFEKGILYTVKELLVRPGQSVREFIADNRNRLVKPIIFIIITSLIYTIIDHSFHIEDGYINFSSVKKTNVARIYTWLQNHYGYANIIMSVFIAFWLKLFFKKHGYNFFEILILLCFLLGMGMLIFSVFSIFEGITKIKVLAFSGMAGVLYCCWGIGQFFNPKKASSYLKALVAYILGMICFTVIAVLIGILADLILKP